MKKKSVLAISIAIFAMVLGGCGTNTNAQNESTTEGTTISANESTSEGNSESASEDLAAKEEEKKFYEGFILKEETFPQLEDVKSGDDIATINTNMGTIKVRFFQDKAPKAVENFLTHSKNGYYNGVIFHRVLSNFMIQGGDPEGTGMGGESIWKQDFENEVSPNLRNFRGALCMANRGPDTNGSQFYIVQTPPSDKETAEYIKYLKDNKDQPVNPEDPSNPLKVSDIYPELVLNKYAELGGYPSLDFGYTVFGQVYEGMDVVDKISAVETEGENKPVKDVIIESIEVAKYEG